MVLLWPMKTFWRYETKVYLRDDESQQITTFPIFWIQKKCEHMVWIHKRDTTAHQFQKKIILHITACLHSLRTFTSHKPAVLSSDGKHFCLLVIDCRLVPFEKKRCNSELVLFKAFDLHADPHDHGQHRICEGHIHLSLSICSRPNSIITQESAKVINQTYGCYVERLDIIQHTFKKGRCLRFESVAKRELVIIYIWKTTNRYTTA